MDYKSTKHCASLYLTLIKASKRIRAHSPSCASSASQSGSDIYTPYSPTREALKNLGKKVEELKHYIGELEASCNEQLTTEEEARLKHAEEVETFEERIAELQATIQFQTTMLDTKERDVERLEVDNDRLRTENQAIIDEHLQDDMNWAHTFHEVQEGLIEYIKALEA
ncbi:hypothetical protein P692DRAFT_20882092 [Suillus brevipes Sb2]|nr:hypothetical protein P692DRAFT_20882092 [Suillus brevipes Sb2]